MDTNSFYEQNKHALENPNHLELPDYLQKLHNAISGNPDWQNALANPRRVEIAIRYIRRMSHCISHDIVAAIALNTQGSSQWAQAYMQNNSLFTYRKLFSLLDEAILLPEHKGQIIIQKIIALNVKPKKALMTTAINQNKLKILHELSKRGVARISDRNEALYSAIGLANVEAVKVLINNHIDITVKNTENQNHLEYAQSLQKRSINFCHKEKFEKIISLLETELNTYITRKQTISLQLIQYCAAHQHLTQLPMLLAMQRH